MSNYAQNRQWIDSIRRNVSSLNFRRFPVALVTLCFILWFTCFFELGRVDLIDLVDEGLYSSVARQMVETGDWITPRVGTVAIFDKPPLMYWSQAVFMRLLGFTPFAARLPSSIAASLTALLLYYWAKKKGISQAGWLAAVFYVLCPLTALGLARLSMMDSILTLWLTLAVIGWIEGYQGNRKGYLLMAAAVGLATMTKGIIGILLPGAGFLVWLLIRRDWQEFRRFPWLIALCIFILLVFPWHFAAWQINGDEFFQEYIMRHHVQRFLGQGYTNTGSDLLYKNNLLLHNLPFWYYLPVTFLVMFPFSVFVPAAWWRGLRAWRSEKRSLDCAMSIWVLWTIIVIGFFSVASSKLPSYVLPALPALVLLAAWRLDSIWQTKKRLSITESIILCIAGGLLGIITLVSGILGWQWREQPFPPSQWAKGVGRLFNWKESQNVDVLWQQLLPITALAPYWILLGAMLLICLISFVIYWRDPPKMVFTTILMGMVMMFVLVHAQLPLWAGYWTPRKQLGQLTLPALQKQEPLVLYSLKKPQATSLRFVLGHNEQIIETYEPEILQSVLREKGRGYVLTVKDASLPALPGKFQQEATGGKWILWRYDDTNVQSKFH